MEKYYKGLVALMLIATSAHAVDLSQDDKKKHIGVSAGIALASTVIYKDTDHPYLYSALTTLGVGLAKESYDHYQREGFSDQDLVADAIGTTIGLSLGYGVAVVVSNSYTGLQFSKGF